MEEKFEETEYAAADCGSCRCAEGQRERVLEFSP